PVMPLTSPTIPSPQAHLAPYVIAVTARAYDRLLRPLERESARIVRPTRTLPTDEPKTTTMAAAQTSGTRRSIRPVAATPRRCDLQTIRAGWSPALRHSNSAAL